MATIKTKADYFKETPYFKIMQPNPTEPERRSTKGDCVIRAFAIAGDIKWEKAFDLLVLNARANYNNPLERCNYEVVFGYFGFQRKTIPRTSKNMKRMNVEEFCKNHPKGRFILRLAHHLTAVVDGVCYDTWNTANKTIYTYYELTNNYFDYGKHQ